MLGTDKPMPARGDVSVEIVDLNMIIDTIDGSDKEDRFLQKAALVYNYRRSGFVPVKKQEVTLTMAENESLPYCSTQAVSLLNNILEEDNAWLFKFWLFRCAAKQQLLIPDHLPVALDKAQKDTELQQVTITCSGKRGEWLSRFNPHWNYFQSTPDDEIWLTGKPEERLKVLQKTRREDPEKALQMIRETWDQENAASKADLVKTLKANLSKTDLDWLESVQTEKSQKVKDELLDLLTSIPGSAINQKYENLLRQSVSLKKEKGLLGLMSKVGIQQKLPDSFDESIFKMGIEKFATGKSTTSDEGYIIYQLVSLVPPSFWEKQFEVSPDVVVEYFDKYAKSLLPALSQAVIRFNADNWIPFLLDQSQFYPEFFYKLNAEDQEKYLLHFFYNDSFNTIQNALTSTNEWGLKFTLTAMHFMANNPYHYNRNFFKENIRVINPGILPKLESITSKDANLQNNWEKIRDYLNKLLALKQQIRQVF